MKAHSFILAIVVIALALMAWKSVELNPQPRTMPLVPMMRLLLSDIYTVDEGIYVENYKKIEEGARSIADHPVMTEEDKKLVKSALGEKMKQFVDFDIVVHHHADSIVGAARQQQMDEVIRHYRIVQQGCVDCHSNFRPKILEAKE